MKGITKKKLKEAIQVLEQHNKWRRGDENLKMADPTILGKSIDLVISELKSKVL